MDVSCAHASSYSCARNALFVEKILFDSSC